MPPTRLRRCRSGWIRSTSVAGLLPIDHTLARGDQALVIGCDDQPVEAGPPSQFLFTGLGDQTVAWADARYEGEVHGELDRADAVGVAGGCEGVVRQRDDRAALDEAMEAAELLGRVHLRAREAGSNLDQTHIEVVREGVIPKSCELLLGDTHAIMSSCA